MLDAGKGIVRATFIIPRLRQCRRGIQAMRLWDYKMCLFQKAECKDPNRPAAALTEAITIEMPETKGHHSTSVQAENQLAAAPIPKEDNLQVEREEAKHYDSKDEPNEEDKAVSGHALPFTGMMFMAAGGIANVYVKAHWNQTESAHQQTGLEYHLQSIRLASFMGMLILAFPLLSYAVNNPASTGSATRTKQMIMNVGIGILIAYVISETVIAMPGSYWTTALSYLLIGVILIIIFMWFLVKWFQKTPAGDANDSSATQRVTQGNKKEDRGAAGIGSTDDKELRDSKEDYSIKKCVNVAHKYKDIIPANKRVKAYDLLQSDSSLRELFLTMDEDEQKIWLSNLSNY